jgi:hypothetical protein
VSAARPASRAAPAQSARRAIVALQPLLGGHCACACGARPAPPPSKCSCVRLS